MWGVGRLLGRLARIPCPPCCQIHSPVLLFLCPQTPQDEDASLHAAWGITPLALRACGVPADVGKRAELEWRSVPLAGAEAVETAAAAKERRAAAKPVLYVATGLGSSMATTLGAVLLAACLAAGAMAVQRRRVRSCKPPLPHWL